MVDGGLPSLSHRFLSEGLVALRLVLPVLSPSRSSKASKRFYSQVLLASFGAVVNLSATAGCSRIITQCNHN